MVMIRNPLLDEADNMGVPSGPGAGRSAFEGQSILNQVMAAKPAPPPGAELSSVNFTTWNPGEGALRYSLGMNKGIPDAVTDTAKTMGWSQHYAPKSPAAQEAYQDPSEMQHQALGVAPAMYKFYNQIGGATAYGGSAGYGGGTVSPTIRDNLSEQGTVQQMKDQQAMLRNPETGGPAPMLGWMKRYLNDLLLYGPSRAEEGMLPGNIGTE